MAQQFAQNIREQFEPENLPVGWPWRLFSVSLIIFLATVISYLGLVFGYEPFLVSKISEIDQEFEQLAQSVPKEDQEKFSQFYSQLANLKSLMENHIVSSRVFPLLEQITNKKIYYASADLKISERKLELEGVADSYEILSEQLESFSRNSSIERFIFNQSQLSGGKVQFSAVLIFKSEVFK